MNSITKKESARLKYELIDFSNGKKSCTDQVNYLGYVSSVGIWYVGRSTTGNTKNWINIAVMDKNRKNREEYWTQYDANTDAGKAINTVAMYTAASGEKVSAQCTVGSDGNDYNIKSLWVGPDAW
ncbi:hypothetical protein [Xenorhabdus sp. TS4]|uniref:hypothetical protein n=1 Tax=Xenorhabdus sp. TS4 TaxID=1873483 RepID=UPI001656D216|nr:hypothetical protein [Xenorhabdus sp. TS4]MBC8950189.1 hypothetical protein [Xenorhabdus sp. TS4]